MKGDVNTTLPQIAGPLLRPVGCHSPKWKRRQRSDWHFGVFAFTFVFKVKWYYSLHHFKCVAEPPDVLSRNMSAVLSVYSHYKRKSYWPYQLSPEMWLGNDSLVHTAQPRSWEALHLFLPGRSRAAQSIPAESFLLWVFCSVHIFFSDLVFVGSKSSFSFLIQGKTNVTALESEDVVLS